MYNKIKVEVSEDGMSHTKAFSDQFKFLFVGVNLVAIVCSPEIKIDNYRRDILINNFTRTQETAHLSKFLRENFVEEAKVSLISGYILNSIYDAEANKHDDLFH